MSTKNKNLKVRLTEAEHTALSSVASRSGKTISDLIRPMIDNICLAVHSASEVQ